MTHGFIISALGVIFIFVYDMVTQTENFNASEIIIKGNKKLDNNKILKIAGIKKNQNMLNMNLKIIKNRLLNEPWINNAVITRKLPHRIEIKIQEEDVLAKVELKKDSYFLINKKGKIFKKAEKVDDKLDIPLITGLTFFDIEKKNFYTKAAIQIAKMKNRKKNLFISGNNTKIHVDRDTGIYLFNTLKSEKLFLGFNGFDRKYKNLKLLAKYLSKKFPGQKMENIDLSKKNRVIIKPFPAMG